MKLIHLATASAAIALLGGAAYAQQTETTPDPNSAPVTQEGAPTSDTATPPATAATPPPVNSDAATTPDAATPPASAAAPPPGVCSASAPSATQFAQQSASFSNLTVTNGPVPDTPENRSKFGGPDSRAGRMTKPAGN
jgi:hypothetical protein